MQYPYLRLSGLPADVFPKKTQLRKTNGKRLHITELTEELINATQQMTDMFQLREENAELKRRVSSSETNKGKILSTIVAEYDILLKEAKQEAKMYNQVVVHLTEHSSGLTSDMAALNSKMEKVCQENAKLLDSISDLSKQQMKMETANQELQRQVETLRRANEILSKQNQQLIKKEVPVKSHRTPLVETRSASCESFSNNKNLNKDVLLF